MPYIPLEKMIRKDKTSLYKIALTAAARANELAQGAKPLIEVSSKKVTSIALQEIAGGKVSYEEAKEKSGKSKKSEE